MNSNGGKSMKKVSSSRARQSERIRQMVIAAMLSAIVAVLTFTPIGMIPLPPPLPAATTVHIPVLVAVLVEGPVVGLIVGAVFGICSFIRAWQLGSIGLTLFFRNPLISVLPRLLVPLAALGVWLLWRKLIKHTAVTDKIGAALAAVVGTLTNTVLCLGLIALIYGGDLTVMLNEMISAGNADAAYLNNAGAWLVAVVGVPNGIGECIVAALIVPMIKAALDAVIRRTPAKKGIVR